MLHNIATIQDVETFIKQIALEINDFHPMLDFTSYVYPDSYMQRYTEEEAEIRNKLLSKCLDVLAKQNADFYTFLLDVFEMATDKLARTPVSPAL